MAAMRTMHLLPLSLRAPPIREVPAEGVPCDVAAPFRDLDYALPAERRLRRYPSEYTVSELLGELARRGIPVKVVPHSTAGAS